ncbi:MAG: PrsW family intramembrane metalloprotease [Lachnospiraceae bacterium]|nr:PrsW family intramembrane metalloprotease [Lachnospiraceae bacterium]
MENKTTKYCIHCGQQIPISANFCTFCGNRVSESMVPGSTVSGSMVSGNTESGSPVPGNTVPCSVEHASANPTLNNDLPVYPQNKKTSVKWLPAVIIAFVSISAILAGSSVISTGAGIGFFGVLIFGCVPPIALLIYIYRLDRIEKEPKTLLLLLFVFGALAIVPPIIFGDVFNLIVDILDINRDSLLYIFIENFFAVALLEELSKYLVVKKLTWKHPSFNYRFDGVVYGATAALGFAMLENIFYVSDDGIGSAIARAGTSIPGHCMFGIYIGYYYGQAKSLELRGMYDKSRKMRLRGLCTAILMHGLYDFVCSIESGLMVLMLLVLIVVYNVFAFINVHKYANEDKML